MDIELLTKLAELSIKGEETCVSISQFCEKYPDISETEAYTGQEIRLRIMESKGFRMVGYKLGGTSLAKQAQLKSSIYSGEAAKMAANVQKSQISYGRLMNYMKLEGEELSLDRHLHPKVEAEFAFVMRNDLMGPDINAADVIWATDYVAPSFEIIDSRFHDFKIGRRPDAIIDNTSASAFKMGEGKVDPRKVDLNTIGMKFALNKEYTGFGSGASIMGHPAHAVAELVHMLDQRGLGLKAGDIILSGAISPSIKVKVGDRVRADFGKMGFVELRVTE